MGFFKRLIGMNDDPTDGVRGTAYVVSCTGYHGGAVYQNCRMELVVEADELEATAVSWHGIVHNQRWPSPGMTIPVLVDPHDPDRLKLLWDEIERSDDRARDDAEQLAALMRERSARGGGGPEK